MDPLTFDPLLAFFVDFFFELPGRTSFTGGRHCESLLWLLLDITQHDCSKTYLSSLSRAICTHLANNIYIE
jgi:hypothetical protein